MMQKGFCKLYIELKLWLIVSTGLFNNSYLFARSKAKIKQMPWVVYMLHEVIDLSRVNELPSPGWDSPIQIKKEKVEQLIKLVFFVAATADELAIVRGPR